MVTEAVILAGGLGTRLRAALPDLPKAMAPVAGRPFLAYLLEYLEVSGVRRVVLAVGYRHEAIRDFFGTRYGGIELEYSLEEVPLGTGGAVLQALPRIRGRCAFVLNGDTFLRIDYRHFAAAFEREPDAPLAVALRRVDDTSRYGEVEVTDGRIRGFKTRGRACSGLINAGCYLVARDIFERHPMPPKFSWESDFLEARAAELQPIAFECDAPFIDIGIPQALAEAQTLVRDWVAASRGPQLASRETFEDSRLGADLLWREPRVARFPSPTPTLFLDRDGVIIEEMEYISDPADVRLLDGIEDLVRSARDAGMAVVEVTNQAGIARGYLGWPEFVAVENRTRELLNAHGVHLDGVFACPFHAEGRPPYRHPAHAWRKPDPGMLLAAAQLLNLDLGRSILVGDKIADQQAARAADLACGIHVLTGHGTQHRDAARAFSSDKFPVRIASTAREAADILRQAVGGGSGFRSDEYRILAT